MTPDARRPLRPTVFIECTHTNATLHNTGIQRVVRNILRNAPVIAADYGYAVQPVAFSDDQLECVDVGPMLESKAQDKAGAARAPAPAPALSEISWKLRVLRLLRPLWRLFLRILTLLLPFDSVRRFAYAPHDRASLAAWITAPLRLFRPRPVQDRPWRPTLDDYDDCTGSVLLLLDSSWGMPIWPAIARFRARGGRVIGVIYDLIPITHSHTCVPELIRVFSYWVGEHLRHTDGFVCISQSTANDFARYLSDLKGAQTPRAPIDFFHLGSELDLIDAQDQVRPAISVIFEPDRHVYLMVGSVEPRKNHAFVLEAFERYWERGGRGALVIIGRFGWKTEQLIDQIMNHPLQGERLYLLRDATDAELDHGYRNASSLVIASEIEGFGLPVVEAFQRGLRVICSDIPVFRELADGRASFFDLAEPGNLARALETFEAEVALEARRDRSPEGWIGWRQSTEQLFAAVARTLRAVSASA